MNECEKTGHKWIMSSENTEVNSPKCDTILISKDGNRSVQAKCAICGTDKQQPPLIKIRG